MSEKKSQKTKVYDKILDNQLLNENWLGISALRKNGWKYLYMATVKIAYNIKVKNRSEKKLSRKCR